MNGVVSCALAQKASGVGWGRYILAQKCLLAPLTSDDCLFGRWEFFLALYQLTNYPKGVAFFRVYEQPHEWLFSLPVSVLFRVGSVEKPN